MINIQTPYLVNPIEDFHQITLDLDFASSSGRIVCDLNTCSIGPFGDRQICTRIAPFVAEIGLVGLDIPDPSGQDRQLFSITGSPLRNAPATRGRTLLTIWTGRSLFWTTSNGAARCLTAT